MLLPFGSDLWLMQYENAFYNFPEQSRTCVWEPTGPAASGSATVDASNIVWCKSGIIRGLLRLNELSNRVKARERCPYASV